MGTLDADGKYYIQGKRTYNRAIAPHCCHDQGNCALLLDPMTVHPCMYHCSPEEEYVCTVRIHVLPESLEASRRPHSLHKSLSVLVGWHATLVVAPPGKQLLARAYRMSNNARNVFLRVLHVASRTHRPRTELTPRHL